MKRFKALLEKEDPDKARIRKIALAMGLKYKGFGFWTDPVTGKPSHKEMDGDLVPVDKEEGDEAPSGGFGSKEGMGASFNTFQNKQAPTGTGVNIRDISPDGVAQAPNSDNGRWEPGPDGDNFVNDQSHSKSPNDDIKPDAYVGGNNNMGWTAGKDGDNYTTYDSRSILKKAMGMGHAQSPAEMMEQCWEYILEMDMPTGLPNREAMLKRIQQTKISDRPPEQSIGIGRARSALAKMGPNTRQAALDDLGKTPHISAPAYDGEYDPGEYTKALKAQRKIWNMPTQAHDNELVKRMNENAKSLVSDPNFDMSQLGEELGAGSFGSVFQSQDGNAVIKEGEIGPDELRALYAMKDNPAFPTLLNAEFSTPFLHQSAKERDQPILGRDTQFDPDDYSEWDKMFPTARGKFAMTAAKGRPWYDQVSQLDENGLANARRNIWKARAAMHAAGISHNDMHGGNIFVDDEGNAEILDLGLAKNSPVSALMEAFGGFGDKDYQMSGDAGMGYLPDELQEELAGNFDALREQLMEGIDPDDENAPYDLEDMMTGGIRMKNRDLDAIKERYPALADDEGVKGMIKKLYGSLLKKDPSELEQRMSDAFSQRQADTKKVKLANLLRRARGEQDIEVKNPNVIPPKNMDFDD